MFALQWAVDSRRMISSALCSAKRHERRKAINTFQKQLTFGSNFVSITFSSYIFLLLTRFDQGKTNTQVRFEKYVCPKTFQFHNTKHRPFADLLYSVLQLVALEKDDEHWFVNLVALVEKRRILIINLHWHWCNSSHASLTVVGSSRGSSISAFLRKTLPRHTLHSILSNVGILSLLITPATNLRTRGRKQNH